MNSLPYVQTNPPPKTALCVGDKVFVLSSKPLRSGKVQSQEQRDMDRQMEDEMKEVLRNKSKNVPEYTNVAASQRWTCKLLIFVIFFMILWRKHFLFYFAFFSLLYTYLFNNCYILQ